MAAIAGLELDDWQADTLIDSMRLVDDRWAAREVGVIVGRQNGKGSILEVRQLAGLFVTGERLQVHSAHEFKTCYEHFRRVKDLINGCDLLRDQVEIIRTGAGDQAIELKSGARIRFIARSRSSGRGFTADTVYLDEAFQLDDETIGALLPSLSARPNPQIWYTSSAPHDDSYVLHRLRDRALGGEDPRLFYAEWGNVPDVDPLDRDAWARANPSMGIRIDVEDIAAEQRAMSPAEFARERLGIPDPLASNVEPVIASDVWRSLLDPDSQIASHDMWAITTSPDRKWTTIGIAGRRPDGLLHVESIHRQAGTAWVVERAVEIWNEKRIPVRIHKTGPEGSFIPLLLERGVEVVEVASSELARATSQFVDAANAGELRHLAQPSLDRALSGAAVRQQIDGAMLWSQRTSTVEITPLQAVTVALGGVPVLVRDPQIW